MLPRFESRGIRKTANFVPCVLATKLTVKMAKTLDISRVFVLCVFSGDNSGSPCWARTSDIMINSHALCQLS